MTLLELKNRFVDKLYALYPSHEVDSIYSWTVESILGYNRINIHQNANKNIDSLAENKMLQALSQLAKHEPVQYVLGHTEFYNLKFQVDNRVLIPRPETELLVDKIVKFIQKNQVQDIIDLCTGSGCIAISVAKNFPGIKISAMDISDGALELAKTNAANNHVNVSFIHDNLISPAQIYGKYSLIISNPPYVRECEKALMHKNVLDYEPSIALFVSDADPLVFYRAIALFGKNHLHPKGAIYTEINEALGLEVQSLFILEGYREVEILDDYNGKPRFIKAMK